MRCHVVLLEPWELSGQRIHLEAHAEVNNEDWPIEAVVLRCELDPNLVGCSAQLSGRHTNEETRLDREPVVAVIIRRHDYEEQPTGHYIGFGTLRLA
jgi:hypothetical protein